jgi:hypothetical protein
MRCFPAPNATDRCARDVSAIIMLSSACTGWAFPNSRHSGYSNAENGGSTSLQVGNRILEQEMAAGNLSRKCLECTRTDTNPAVEWHQFGLAHEEADFIVATIKELFAAGTPYREMACLCRCGTMAGFPGALGVMQHLKKALVAAGIPHRAERGRTCAPVLMPLRTCTTGLLHYGVPSQTESCASTTLVALPRATVCTVALRQHP